MSSGATFLTVVGTYAGYCQICQEPRVVARIAVAGWPYHGAVCSGCLAQMADEVQRRAKTFTSGVAGNGNGLPPSTADNGQARTGTPVGNGHGTR